MSKTRDVSDDEESHLETVIFGRKRLRKAFDHSDKLLALEPTTTASKEVEENVQSEDVGLTEANTSKPKSSEGAWFDEDDEIKAEEALSFATKFPRKVDKGDNYKSYLESKFKQLHGVPKWSVKRREKRHVDSESEDEDTNDDLLRTVGNTFKQGKRLSKNILDFKKCANLNQEMPFNGVVSSVHFHPSSTVALVASPTGTVNLFQVDGKVNSKIQTIHFRNFYVDRARFTVDGQRFIVGSNNNSGHYYYYDMIKGKVVNVPLVGGREKTGLRGFVLSSDGKYVACRADNGYIRVYTVQTNENVMDMKMNSDVSALTFSPDSSKVFSHGSEGKVYIWDVRNFGRCFHKFVDEGSLCGTSIAVSQNSTYFVSGSDTGVVNVYDQKDVMASSQPIPRKALMNLTTEVRQLKINHSSELLAMSSSDKPDAVRCVHLSSLTTFSNFPAVGVHYGAIRALDISLNSGYFAFGTNKGHVHLLRLRHYNNY